MNNFLSRAVSGIFYVLLIAFITLYSPITFIAGLSILFILCFWELYKVLKFENKIYAIIAFLISGYLLYSYANNFYLGQNFYPLSIAGILPSVLFLITSIVIFKRPDELGFDSSKLIFSIAYLALPFSLAFTINKVSDFHQISITPLFLIFVLIWFSDTFAYITGSLIGKTKFTSISKNKTLEGLLGGLISVLILGFIIEINFPNLRGNWIIISILVGIFAPIGDLAESKIKRVFGVKDSSNLIPGHGGFLDRLDSFLMVSIIIYTYFIIFKL